MLSVGVDPCRNFLFAEFHHYHHHTCNSHLLCNCHFSGSATLKGKNLRRLIAKATGDYKRVPMETAGAYQLIDRQTGEKLIVWGGVDDEDDSLQLQKILVPLEPQQQTEGDAINHHSTAANSKRTTFGRLKVAKIKSLIKGKSSKFANVTSSDSEEEIMVHDTESGNRNPNSDGAEVTGSGLLTQSESESESESSPQRVNYEQNRGSSRRVDSTMRGWSGATSPIRAYTSVTRQPRKLVADSGFFSRKSFKQLGCTDDMIECLRSQSVLHPSHIQVMKLLAIGCYLHS